MKPHNTQQTQINLHHYFLFFFITIFFCFIGCKGSDPISGGELQQLKIFTDKTSILLGESVNLSVQGYDEDGNPTDDYFTTWHVSDENLAYVTPSGILKPLDQGNVEVYAKSDSIESNRITVAVSIYGSGITVTGAYVPYDIYTAGAFNYYSDDSAIVYRYYITSPSYPVWIKVLTEFDVDVPQTNEDIITYLWFSTEFVMLKTGFLLTNKEAIPNPDVFLDFDGDTIKNVGLEVDFLLNTGFEDLVYETGRLPPGEYTISVTVVDSFGSPVDFFIENPYILMIEDVHSIDLISPGGSVEIENQIFTLYPLFEWNSTGCKNAIRISEYDPGIHSSPEDALNENSSLPFPDDGSYFAVGLETSYQYSMRDGKTLIKDKTYVWQVMKTCKSTREDVEIRSEIWAFTVK